MPISRRRWYHTEIPIWYSENEEYVIVPPAEHVQPWRENPPAGSRVLRRDSREDVGSFEAMTETLGNITGVKGLRYLDGFIKFQPLRQWLSKSTRDF